MFNPPAAPWLGGFYERMVGTVKSALKKVMGTAFLKVQELETLLYEVEAVVNSRPLTYVSDAFDYTSSKSVLNSKCSLESLAYRRQIISLTTFHRYVFHHRDYLADFHFKITNSERRPNKIILPKFKSLSKSLFMFRTAILLNCLPPSLTSEASLYKFKAALRKFTADYTYAINGIPPPCS